MKLINIMLMFALFYAHCAYTAPKAGKLAKADNLADKIIQDVMKGNMKEAIDSFKDLLHVSNDGYKKLSKKCDSLVEYTFSRNHPFDKSNKESSSTLHPINVEFFEQAIDYLSDECIKELEKYVFTKVRNLKGMLGSDIVIYESFKALATIYMRMEESKIKDIIIDENLKDSSNGSMYKLMFVSLAKYDNIKNYANLFKTIITLHNNFVNPNWGIEIFRDILYPADSAKITEVTSIFMAQSNYLKASSDDSSVSIVKNDILRLHSLNDEDLQRIMIALVRSGFDYNRLSSDLLLKIDVPYPNLAVDTLNEWCSGSKLTNKRLASQIKEYRFFDWPGRISSNDEIERSNIIAVVEQMLSSNCLNYALKNICINYSSEGKDDVMEVLKFGTYLNGKLRDFGDSRTLRFPLTDTTVVCIPELYTKMKQENYKVEYKELSWINYPELKFLELGATASFAMQYFDGRVKKAEEDVLKYHTTGSYDTIERIIDRKRLWLKHFCIWGDFVNYQKLRLNYAWKDSDAKCLEYLVDKGHDQDADQLLSFLYDQHEKSKYHPEYAIMKKLLIKAYKKGDKKMVKVLRKHGNRRLAWVLMWLRMKKMFGTLK